jgi:hypothetical protein
MDILLLSAQLSLSLSLALSLSLSLSAAWWIIRIASISYAGRDQLGTIVWTASWAFRIGTIPA